VQVEGGGARSRHGQRESAQDEEGNTHARFSERIGSNRAQDKRKGY
jgi:hypothetical protein